MYEEYDKFYDGVASGMHSLGYEVGSGHMLRAVLLFCGQQEGPVHLKGKLLLSSPPCPYLGGQLITSTRDMTVQCTNPGPVVVLHFTGPRKTPQI